MNIAAGLPLTSYGREKPAFRKYLLRNAGQTTEFGYEGRKYRITIEDVLLFPQGFTALMTQPDLLTDDPRCCCSTSADGRWISCASTTGDQSSTPATASSLA